MTCEESDGKGPKIVCITGGYGKLGTSLATAFKAAGDTVLITGRDKSRLLKAGERLECETLQQDVTREEDAQKLHDYLHEKHGRLDVLINNAAMLRGGPVEQMPPRDFLQVLTVNIHGPFLCTQALLPLLKASPTPLVLNISSTSGHRPDPGMAAYNASKFGLRGLTDTMRLELRKHNIRVTSLSPSSLHFGDGRDCIEGSGLKGEDLADIAVYLSRSPGRALVRDIEVWATNP